MPQSVACQCRELCKQQEEGGKLVSRVRGLTGSRNPAVTVQPSQAFTLTYGKAKVPSSHLADIPRWGCSGIQPSWHHQQFFNVIVCLHTNIITDQDISQKVTQKLFLFRKLGEVSVAFKKCHSILWVGGCMFLETSRLYLHFLGRCLMNECGCISASEWGGQVFTGMAWAQKWCCSDGTRVTKQSLGRRAKLFPDT